MRWIQNLLREFYGLFVDDGLFALFILLWSIVAGLGLPALRLSRPWGGLIFFLGLAAILLDSVRRRSKA